jgi:ATP-dependent RNA helicase RhlE
LLLFCFIISTNERDPRKKLTLKKNCQIMRFEDLKIIEPVLKALKEEEYTEPTAIQSKAIPIILNKRDLMGSAQTGTGKTAAFAIPILQHLYEVRHSENSRPRLSALIITPTRELAIQIGESFSVYGKYTGIKTIVIYGGVNQGSQTDLLKRGAEVLVATPGRLLDLMGQGYISLKGIQYFVLDEADRMLDMGFIHDIKKIIEQLPKKRQSLFFSATMPKSIIELSGTILNNPVKIAVSPESPTAETIRQFIYFTNKSTKNDLLVHILSDSSLDQVLVFSRTKYGADRISKVLKKQNIKTAVIHGDKAQNQRQKALGQLKNGEVRVLVATDIAARGIDVEGLKYVINFDIPDIAETYVHRIGRSGRAGDAGVSISLCEPEEISSVKEIEKLIRQKIEVINRNPYPQTDQPMSATEKKEAEKEKSRRKQEYFAGRNRNKGNSRS